MKNIFIFASFISFSVVSASQMSPILQVINQVYAPTGSPSPILQVINSSFTATPSVVSSSGWLFGTAAVTATLLSSSTPSAPSSSWGGWLYDQLPSWETTKQKSRDVVTSAASSYAQTKATQYLYHILTEQEKKSIKHEVPAEKPKPTKYEGSYNTPLGTYTLSELLEISQAEAALGKRGPFSDMLLYVLRDHDNIPLDAKKSA